MYKKRIKISCEIGIGHPIFIVVQGLDFFGGGGGGFVCLFVCLVQFFYYILFNCIACAFAV